MGKINKLFNWKTRVVLLIAMVGGLIGFTGFKKTNEVFTDIKVQINNDIENHFLDEETILKIIESDGSRPVMGEPIDLINLKELEKDLEENPFIRSGEVFKDLEGRLQVTVELERPVARILNPSGPDAYITASGHTMPVSDAFVSRVMLIHGKNSDHLIKPGFYEEEYGTRLLEMINFIDKDPFWKAQVAELYLLKNGKINILPQVTRQKVEFGQPENIEEKFGKLKVFYSKVLPVKGWNDYSRINLEYKKQIIAE